jgi:F0F1-type ATP synthase assembly protein I
MVKFILVCLLVGNALFFAFTHGYLGDSTLENHDPARLLKQKNPEALRLVTAEIALAAQTPASEMAASTSSIPELAAGVAVVIPPACLMWGVFLPEDVSKVETRLATLSLGERQSRQNVQDGGSYIVYIPSQGSKEGADKKAANLVQLGIREYLIIQDQSKLRWGISLGVFRTEEAARQHLISLNARGVHTAKVGPRTVATTKFIYQLRKLSSAENQALSVMKSDFPHQTVTICK